MGPHLFEVSNFVDYFLGGMPDVARRVEKILGSQAVSVASICTGWGVSDMVIQSVNDFIADNTSCRNKERSNLFHFLAT